MARLHKGSSRSYPGRPVQQAADVLGSALCGNMQGVWAGVSRGHIRRRKSPERRTGDWKRARWIEKPGRLTPLKGQTHRGKWDLICSTTHSTRQGTPMVGAMWDNPAFGITCSCRLLAVKELRIYFIRLRSDVLWEPPSADPLAWWCGGWGRKTPGYPIIV